MLRNDFARGLFSDRQPISRSRGLFHFIPWSSAISNSRHSSLKKKTTPNMLILKMMKSCPVPKISCTGGTAQPCYTERLEELLQECCCCCCCFDLQARGSSSKQKGIEFQGVTRVNVTLETERTSDRMLWREREGSTTSCRWVTSQLREPIAKCRALAQQNLSKCTSEKGSAFHWYNCCRGFEPRKGRASADSKAEKDAKWGKGSQKKELRPEIFVHSSGQLRYCGWLQENG